MHSFKSYTNFNFIFLNFSNGIEIIIRAGRRQCKTHLQNLKSHFTDSMTNMRHNLASVKVEVHENENTSKLSELLNCIITTTTDKLKNALQDLLVRFIFIFIFFF